jgi:hypothetical protein
MADKKIDESKKNQTMQVLLDFKYQGDVYLFLDNQEIRLKFKWNNSKIYITIWI